MRVDRQHCSKWLVTTRAHANLRVIPVQRLSCSRGYEIRFLRCQRTFFLPAGRGEGGETEKRPALELDEKRVAWGEEGVGFLVGCEHENK